MTPTAAAPATASPAGATPTFALIKQLRDATGADLKTCKLTLVETGCDLEAAKARLLA